MNAPEINFATADAQEIMSACLAVVETSIGRPIERADPIRLLLNGLVAMLIQQRLLIDETARMNLLAYSKAEYLDRLGDLVGVERLLAAAATTTVEVRLSAARETATIINAGTRITADDTIYFALDDAVIFAAGETVKTVKATCTVDGEIGNGYAVGELNKIVDPQAFLFSIKNITTTEGGADIESDDSLRERIHQAPESFSVAGSEGAYKYHAKSVSALISDVAIDSPEPGKVDVYVLLKGGELPGEEMLSLVDEHLNAKTIRPLTDQVTVKPPTVEEYEIDATYWLKRDDAVYAEALIEKAQAALAEYIEWQGEKLGRDIVPTALIHRLHVAGVKRVEVRQPLYKATDKFTLAKNTGATLTFGGLEEE